ncbi:MAG: hypothetical protein QMD46_08420 [Methanomicrobiales archaeon]|nr:hypothetical protein [Methanomicrobiales archaeon]
MQTIDIARQYPVVFTPKFMECRDFMHIIPVSLSSLIPTGYSSWSMGAAWNWHL